MNIQAAPKVVIDAFRNCVTRFPVSVAYITALTLFLLQVIFFEDSLFSEQFNYVFSYYLFIGYLLSLTLHLWAEEGKPRKKIIIVNSIAHAILVADSIYLYNISESQFNTELILAHTSSILALWLSMFFLSFLKEKDNIASWNFTMRIIMYFCVTYIIGLIMWGGLSLLLSSLSHLFGVTIEWEPYQCAGVVLSLYLPSLLFLGLIPKGEEKHNRQPVSSGFMNGVIHFLFFPLTCCYVLVLYVYAARILITWELPNGWVSWLIVTLMAGIICLEFGLYPAKKKDGKKIDDIITLWLPIVTLPLLLLMTIGIIRRINDYGISINRLYIMTLNAWFYFVCIGLFVTKAKKINWITISFSLVFLLTSALPLNFVSITKKVIYNQIAEAFKAHGLDGKKLSVKEYDNFITGLPKEEAKSINAKLTYMNREFGTESIEEFIDKDVRLWQYEVNFIEDTVEVAREEIGYFKTIDMPSNQDIDIPVGFSSVTTVSSNYQEITDSTAQATAIELPTRTGEIQDTVYVDIKRLRKLREPYLTPIYLRCNSEKSTFALTSFYITGSSVKPEISVTGLLFKKKSETNPITH